MGDGAWVVHNSNCGDTADKFGKTIILDKVDFGTPGERSLFVNIIQEIQDIFSIQSSQSKRLRLIDLDMIFEMDTSLNSEEVVNAIHSLVSYAFNKNNMEIRDDIFNAIKAAIFYRKVVDKVDWDIVVAEEKNLQKEDLIWIFEFLGSSRK